MYVAHQGGDTCNLHKDFKVIWNVTLQFVCNLYPFVSPATAMAEGHNYDLLGFLADFYMALFFFFFPFLQQAKHKARLHSWLSRCRGTDQILRDALSTAQGKSLFSSALTRSPGWDKNQGTKARGTPLALASPALLSDAKLLFLTFPKHLFMEKIDNFKKSVVS